MGPNHCALLVRFKMHTELGSGACRIGLTLCSRMARRNIKTFFLFPNVVVICRFTDLNLIVDCVYGKKKSYLLPVSCSRSYFKCVIKTPI